MVAYLKRSMREPRKLRKLLCRLMWLSSSSLILPKTYGRKAKGSVIQVRAHWPVEVAARSPWLMGMHPCAARTDPAPGPSPLAQLASKAAHIHHHCAIPHGKAPQRMHTGAQAAHQGAGAEQPLGRRLSSPWQGFAVGGKGCERPSCHGNRSMEDLGSIESNRSTSIPLLCYGKHPSTAWHPAVPSTLEAEG